jgi:hypothetical protein
MPVAEEVRQALDLKSLSLPPSIPVNRVEVENYTDWDGDAALRVLVVLDESVDPETINGNAVADLKRSIHDSLRKHGITLFPYIFFAKPSELAETDDEE